VISTVQFNRELRLLDLPDARWSRYRGAGGMAYPHPITVPEQAALLRRKPNAVVSKTHWPGGKRVRGASLKVYCRGDFEIAWRKQAMLRTRPSGLRPPGQGERSHEERAHGQTF